MISRSEVSLIVTAMGASSRIFGEPEVAVMVTTALLTTLLTPLKVRWAFSLPAPTMFIWAEMSSIPGTSIDREQF